ncbi:hypothetical protein EJ05DRAFT_508466 [Pseudovirgaria hyperparasitica]|uniref:Uncharacterized protein n=1 Tax=Pseudovirgaria hyperparasitica TaxID=470096 RepID=A0A6A6WGW2_9PEZI|nr:uncharacterized protein EJ05DRAFT_508466 [Pseudovirgaria hyperparasitica]KAF2761290.1 hypothetical protein EJ05DRAFT_508466 [Pseudovirgaria hyperparasitica]
MSPDLNTIPQTPRAVASGAAAASTSHHSSTPTSRRASQIFPMSPPPLPLASPSGALPTASNTTAQPFPPLSPGMASVHPPSDRDIAGVPMRHPRPLTAAELHLELEKEQEAVVNRLTRELSALRAHSASVASTASSTASGGALLFDATDPSAQHTGALTGPTHPTASRRHRSSSSISRTSQSTGYVPHSASSSAAGPHRYSMSSQPGSANDVAPPRSASIGLSTPRYEEVAHYRMELEEAKRENDLLRRKIRDLERTLRGRRDSSTDTQPRGRRERAGDNAGSGNTISEARA